MKVLQLPSYSEDSERSSTSGYDLALSFNRNCRHLLQPISSAVNRIAPGDLLIIDSDDPLVIGSVARVMADIAARPQVMLLFRCGDVHSLAMGSLRASLLKHALQKIVRTLGYLPRMMVPHMRLARALEDLTGSSCIVVDYSNGEWTDVDAVRSPLSADVALLADADDPQSAFALPEIAGEILRSHAHGLVLGACHLRRSYPLRELAAAGRINVVDDPDGVGLSFPAAALLVLSRRSYREKAPSRFSRLVCAGVPLVVPSGTCMADFIDRGEAIGLHYSNDTTASVIACAGMILNDLEPWRRAAELLAPIWRRRRSPAHLVDVLLDSAARTEQYCK